MLWKNFIYPLALIAEYLLRRLLLHTRRENIVSCEINPFGKKILQHYWPNSYHHEDIKTLTHEIIKSNSRYRDGKPTILVGGFPCQPYSIAGKRKGSDDTRHLWPEMLRLIREVKPQYVVGENVLGLTNWDGGVVFEQVCLDLEAEGYEVQPVVLPACGVGAPHRRDRVWFIAYSHNSRVNYGSGVNNYGQKKNEGWEVESQPEFRKNGFNEATTNPHSDGLDRRNSEHEEYTGKGRVDAQCDIDAARVNESSTNTSNKGLQRGEIGRGAGRGGENENQFPAGCFRSRWEKFPTVSPLYSGDDGLSDRLDPITVSGRKGSRTLNKQQGFNRWRQESIKAAGNAIVPQVVFQIFKAIQEYENMQIK